MSVKTNAVQGVRKGFRRSIRSVRRHSLLSLAAAAVAWPALRPVRAYAQYTNKLTTTPDLVQDNFGSAGDELPYDGLAYCCPTAVAMSLGYLGINGFNQIAPSDPTPAQELNLVEVLGGLMATNPTTGTATNTDIANAVDIYLNSKGINSSNYSTNFYSSPTISELAGLNQNQSVIDLVCGFYDTTGARIGGHCVALDSQAVNLQGQSSPATLAINNPGPSTFGPFPDDAANSVQYDNTIATSGNVTSKGALELDPSQYNDYNGTTRTVVETAFDVTVDANEQSINNPVISPWTLSTTQSLNLNSGTLSVIAPLQGAGGISEGGGGVLDLEAADSTTGANTIDGGFLESNVASGQPFGTGSITLQNGTLELDPVAGSGTVSLTAANGSGATLTINSCTAINLVANGYGELAFTIGGNSGNGTANLVRTNNGTLVIAPDEGTAALGSTEEVIVAGSGSNLPQVTNGIVAPYIVSSDNDGFGSGDFLTYGTSGFAQANYLLATNSAITTTNATTVYYANTAQSVPANTTAQVYALKVGPYLISGGSASVLKVGPQTSGSQAGVILNGGTIATTDLNFGAAEGLIYTSQAGGTVTSVIHGSGGLTTFGPGNLTLEGANTYTGGTQIEGNTLIAANSSGSATGSGPITVRAGGTLEISGASARAGGTGGTTINSRDTLWLNGGTLTGTVAENGFLQGQGTISGAVTLDGTIGSTAASGPNDITFTNSVNVATGNSNIYSWQLDALDDNPADAGTNWSLLNFTDGTQVNFGTSSSSNTNTDGVNYALNLGASVPDPNSGNPFWNVPHQWLIADAEPYFNYFNCLPDFPTYAQGYFTISLNAGPPYIDQYANYVPYAQPQGAAAGTWNAGSGTWTSGGNWLYNVIPQAVGDTANFTAASSAPVNVTLDAAWIVGVVNFNNSQSYVLAAGAGGTLTLANGQSNAQINDTGGTHTISAPMLLNSSLNVDVSNAGDTMNLSGAMSGPGGLTITGSGTVLLGGSNSYSGGTTVNGGTLLVAAANALPTGSSVTIGGGTLQLARGIGAPSVGSLTINGGTLDLTNASIYVTYNSSDPALTIFSYLQSGYNDGGWNGTGIDSSAVASLNASQSAMIYSVGYADGADGIVNGLSSGQIEIMPTLAGDAKLQGNVVFGDFQLLSQYFGQTGTSWDEGNFTYGSSTNFGDFQLLSQNFGANSSALTAGEIASLNGFAAQFNEEMVPNANGGGYSLVSVPEPASVSVMALLAAGWIGKRKRKQGAVASRR